MATAVVPCRAAGQSYRAQLPAEVTSFIGRKGELNRLSAILASARLVTVVGPAGVGKTRVAVQAAQRAAQRYPDGVTFADLSGIGDSALVAATVAGCLGLPAPADAAARTDTARGGPGDLTAVLDHLRGRRQLIVLDTCEHVLDECAALAETVLRGAPGVGLLATSRQPLDVPGEHIIPIGPLPVPSPVGGLAEAAEAGHDDALELFAVRAAAAVPGFQLTDSNRADAIRLCQRLDGIPLAIELATVRLRVLSLPDLVQRLEQLFRVLGGGRRGTNPRHQTLQTAIAWSYNLCTQAERTLWARLSAFSGSFDVAAVEQVCADPDTTRQEVMHTLIGLVDKSVVLRDSAAAARYRLPETLRQFGVKQLASAGAGDKYRARHLSYCVRAARRFRRHILDDDQPARFRELRDFHDNLKAALEYALEDTGSGERLRSGAELAVLLHPYWLISGLLNEGRDWLDRFDRRLPGTSAERAEVLIVRGCLRGFAGECAGGAADTRSGTGIAAALGADRLVARGYLYLNIIETFGGRHAEAAAAGAEAERRLAAAGSPAELLFLDIQMAHHYQLTGQPKLAIARCQRGLRRLEHTSEQWLHGYLHLIMSMACLQRPGQRDRCTASAVKGLYAKHELGDVIGTAYALDILAWLAADASRFTRAAWLAGAAEPLWERAGNRLSDTPGTRERAMRAAREHLGGKRAAVLRAQGANCPLDHVVAAAASDADGLPAAPAAAALPLGKRKRDRGAHMSDGLLTKRETQIAELVTRGLSNREIAERLVISKRTVDAHVEHIFSKLGISSRMQLTAERAPVR
jgi:non-specific serine/threonine protein kinase